MNFDFIRRFLGQPGDEENKNPSGQQKPEQERPATQTPATPATNNETPNPGLQAAIDPSLAKTDELKDPGDYYVDDDTHIINPTGAQVSDSAVEDFVQLSELTRDLTRRLPPEIASATNSKHLIYSLTSDKGMVRVNNEDAAFAFFSASKTSDERPDFGLFIVADGMGGHQDGEKASALAARTLATHIIEEVYIPIMKGVNDSDRQKPINETLITAANKANENVLRQVKDGGTTLTAVTIIGNLAHIVHVGDSRVYLVTNDSIERLTRDHSLVQRLIELDHITQDEAIGHAQAGILYRAIGQNENLEVDTITRRLPSNATLLVCSDGLWGEVSEAEIYNVVSEHEPQTACDLLVTMANSRGGKDNITVIVMKLPK